MTGERTELNPSPTPLEIPRDKRGRIRWLLISQDPERLGAVIESEARRILEDRQTLPKGELTKRLLTQNGRSDLIGGISRYYPGGISGLKKSLGINLRKDNYWTPETIEQEATILMSRTGTTVLPSVDEIEKVRSDLAGAIYRYYPGGLIGLRENLGQVLLHKPAGYWKDPIVIEREAQEFYAKEGQLTQASLSKKGRSDLVGATKYYPGGMYQLGVNLGIDSNRKPKGYWTIENIEAEASKFFSEHGELTVSSLRRNGQNTLPVYIRRNYPGGLVALRERLGIIGTTNSVLETVSPEQANKQLERLLE